MKILTLNCHKVFRFLLAGVFAVTALCVLSLPAKADDASEYQPDGSGLFSNTDIRGNNAPTLFESYSGDAYSLDVTDAGTFALVDNTIDPIIDALSETGLNFTKFFTSTAIYLNQKMSDFKAYEVIGGKIDSSMSKVAAELNSWLLPSALAVGGLVALSKMRSQRGQAFSQILYVVAAGALALSMSTMPGAWTSAVNTTRNVGADVATRFSTAATEELTSPFTVSPPTFNGEEKIQNQRRMADAIWRTYVVTPWCLAEFGNMKTCEKFGNQMLATPQGERASFIDGAIAQTVGDGSDAHRHIGGHAPTQRLFVTWISALAALVFSFLNVTLILTSISYMLLSLMLLFLGPFFAQCLVIPGIPRSWGARWAQLLIVFTFMSFLTLLIQSAVLAISMSVVAMTGAYGWVISTLLSLFTAFTGLTLIRHLRDIFNLTQSGTGALVGNTLGYGFMAKSLLSGRRNHPKAPGGKLPGREPLFLRREQAQSPGGDSGGWKNYGGNTPKGPFPSQGAPSGHAPTNPTPSPYGAANTYRAYPQPHTPREHFQQRQGPARGGRWLQPPRPTYTPNAPSAEEPPRFEAPKRRRAHELVGDSFSHAGHPHLRRGPGKRLSPAPTHAARLLRARVERKTRVEQ